MVQIENLQKMLVTFNLEQSFFVNQTGLNGVGEPESVTFLPREVKSLPDEVLDCAEIKSALAPTNGNKPTLRLVS